MRKGGELGVLSRLRQVQSRWSGWPLLVLIPVSEFAGNVKNAKIFSLSGSSQQSEGFDAYNRSHYLCYAINRESSVGLVY